MNHNVKILGFAIAIVITFLILIVLGEYLDIYLNILIIYNLPVKLLAMIVLCLLVAVMLRLTKLNRVFYVFILFAIVIGILTTIYINHSAKNTISLEIDERTVYVQEISDENNSGHYNVCMKMNFLYCEKIETLWFARDVIVSTSSENNIITFTFCKNGDCWEEEVTIKGVE